jgi:hypothetical protein
MSSRNRAVLRACAVLVLAVLALTAWRDIAAYREQRARINARIHALQEYEQSLRGGGFVHAAPASYLKDREGRQG